ncbi:MAG: preprotein translocase subunit SecG, partial [Flammeovirgaceae bacterium]
MLYTLFIVLAIVSAILLVLVVLAQNSKGGGLSG